MIVLNRYMCCNSKFYMQIQCIRRGLSFSARHHKAKISYTVFPDSHAKLDLDRNPPIFILHGLFGSKTNWRSLAKRINSLTHRHVVTLDARNHGDSEHHPAMDYLTMRDDVLAVMDALNVEKPVLLGHSMGGKTVMACALSVPERVESLIVVDTAPRDSPGLDTLQRYAQKMKSMTLPDATTSPPHARRIVGDELKGLVKEDGVRQFLLTNLRQATDNSYMWRVNLDAVINNFDSLHSFPAQLTVPCTTVNTIFIGGARSLHVDSSAEPSIHRLFPEAPIQLIPEAGHWVHSDRPKQFVDMVQDFILLQNV